MRVCSVDGKGMKRLRRIIFNGLATLSLIICLALVGIWARSYFVHEMVLSCVRNGKGDLCIYRRLIVGNGGIAIHSRSKERRYSSSFSSVWIDPSSATSLKMWVPSATGQAQVSEYRDLWHPQL